MKPETKTHLTPVTTYPKPFKFDPFFERIRDFQDTMMRNVFDLFAPYPFAGFPEVEKLFKETEYWPVPLELIETEEGLLIHADVPGFKDKELEVRVEPWRLYISGKKEEPVELKKGKTVYSERHYNQIARWFELPVEVNPDKVKATLNKGVLEINLLKAQPAKMVPIEVKAA